jgi:hypothetical protein
MSNISRSINRLVYINEKEPLVVFAAKLATIVQHARIANQYFDTKANKYTLSGKYGFTVPYINKQINRFSSRIYLSPGLLYLSSVTRL